MPAAVHPTGMRQDGSDVLVLDWSDGATTRHPVRELRLACRCAACVDEWTNASLLDPSSVPADVRPIRIEPVGRYGLQVEWSDGHSTGIYTFDSLRERARRAEG